MLGRLVDRAVFGTAGAVGGYLLFLRAWGSIPLAMALALLCCVLAGELIRRRPRRCRRSLAQARQELLRVAALPEAEAQQRLEALVRRRYPGESFRLAPVLKHPEAALSSGDVMNAWKAHRDAERLVIAATCPCEPRAALYARELTAPPVVVLDSRRLLRLLTAEPVERAAPAHPPALSQRLRRAAGQVLARRATPREGALAAGLLALYLIRGTPTALFAALALMAHLGLSLRRHRLRRTLF